MAKGMSLAICDGTPVGLLITHCCCYHRPKRTSTSARSSAPFCTGESCSYCSLTSSTHWKTCYYSAME
jgi:hypothetical protein